MSKTFLKTSKKKADTSLSEGSLSFLSSVISIVIGLAVGFVILILLELTGSNSNLGTPVSVFGNFLTYPFQRIELFIKVFYNAAPLMLVGLAVGFAFKAGLFNIGATGQYTLGAYFALVAVILLQFPWWAGLLVGMVFGALWGAIPGLFKAHFNINEVITTIMLNWVALSLCNLLLYNMPNMHLDLPNKVDKIMYRNPSGIIPDWGLKELFGLSSTYSYINIGIFIAIFVAVIIYIVLNKTTFGYEVKACGYNKNAAKYAGIKAKRTIIFTMIISGGLAGLAGGVSYLAGTVQFNAESNLLAMGFNGIPVALLASSNPLGIIASSVLIGFMQVGGQAFEGVYSSEMTNVILSVIIYFSAFSLIISQTIQKIQKKRKMKDGLDVGDDSEIIELSKESPPPEDGQNKTEVTN